MGNSGYFLKKGGRVLFSVILAMALVLVFDSCVVKKRKFGQLPQVDNTMPEDYLMTTDSLQRFNNNEILVSWWKQFGDPVLDTLLAMAKNNNKDINTAISNFYAARAGLRSSKFDRFPTVTANGNYTRQRLGENIFVSGSNPTFGQYNGTFDANWEIGLFGRIGNRIKAAKSLEQAELADMQDVYLSIYAEIASTYMTFRGTQNQLSIALRNAESQKETYELTERLFIAGTGNKLDVARAQAQHETTKATIPPIKALLTELENRLSVLIGEIPGTTKKWLDASKPLPSIPASVPVGNVSDLIRRRPDIFRAENLLNQQIAVYNLTAAEIFPKISFTGNIGFSAIDFSNFGERSSFVWSLAPTISWAAFNLGRVKQNINQQDALALGLIEQYEQTVLLALEEIKTNMAFYQGQLQRGENLVVAVQASNLATKLSKDRYEAGLDDFLDVLNAQLAALQAENELAIAETNTATGLIAIYKALGGGWETLTRDEANTKFQQLKENDITKNKKKNNP